MRIERQSPFTGKVHVMDLDITTEQVTAYERGTLLQDAFPNLSAEEREFYKTGITPEEWKTMLAPEEEDDADFDPEIYADDDHDLRGDDPGENDDLFYSDDHDATDDDWEPEYEEAHERYERESEATEREMMDRPSRPDYWINPDSGEPRLG